MIMGCIILIVTLTVALVVLYRHGNHGMRCPKCGNNMTCYHLKYKDHDKEYDQYTYTCHNCDFRTIIKV